MTCSRELIVWFSDSPGSEAPIVGEPVLVAECKSVLDDCGFWTELHAGGGPQTDKNLWNISDKDVLEATLAHIKHADARDKEDGA